MGDVITPENVENQLNSICRICMTHYQKYNAVNIFEARLPNNVLIQKALQLLTSIEIHADDEFPPHLCISCESRVYDAWRLREQMEVTMKRIARLRDVAIQTRLANEMELENAAREPSEEYVLVEEETIPPEEEEEEEEEKEDPEEQEDDDEAEISNDPEELSGYIVTNNEHNAAASFRNEQIADHAETTAFNQITRIYARPEEESTSTVGSMDDDQGVQTKRRKSQERKYKCEACSKKFLRKSNLIDHLRLHANERNFQCEHCDKSFVQSGNYKAHLRTHTKERPYVCYIVGKNGKVCCKSYNQSSALKVHIRSHTNERNYVCDVCTKAFTNSSDLAKHKRVHDTVKKYSCDRCDKTFAQKNNLKNHILTNHSHRHKDAKRKAN